MASRTGTNKTASSRKTSQTKGKTTTGSSRSKGKSAAASTKNRNTGTGTQAKKQSGTANKAYRQMTVDEIAPAEKQYTSPVLVKEAVLWLILAVCILIFISYFGVGGYLGGVISDVCFGIFGVAAYLFPVLVFTASAFLISNRGNNIAMVKFLSAILLYFDICSFIGLFYTSSTEGFSLSAIYERSAAFKQGGGAAGGMICSFLVPALGAIGAGVILVILAIIFLILITQRSVVKGVKKQSRRMYESARESSARRRESYQMDRMRRENERVMDDEFLEKDPLPDPVSKKDGRSDRPALQIERQYVKPARVEPEHTEQTTGSIEIPVIFPANPRESRLNHRVSGVTMDTKLSGDPSSIGGEVHEIIPKAYLPQQSDELPEDKETMYMELERETGVKDDKLESSPQSSGLEIYQEEQKNQEEPQELDIPIVGIKSADDSDHAKDSCDTDDSNAVDDDDNHSVQIEEPRASEKPDKPEKPKKSKKSNSDDMVWKDENAAEETSSGVTFTKNPRSSKKEIEEGIANVEAEMAKTAEIVKPEYVFPPIRLLKHGSKGAGAGQEKEVRSTAMKLQQTLNSFGVHVTVTNVSCGPSVTRYELLPEQGVKVSRIVSLSDDIKLNLAAADIRIEAPIPGKAAVGIEVPNSENSMVALRDLLESDEFVHHKSNLAFAVGKDIGGRVVVADIAKMPHLLIAGATGSGKSVCINTLIMSILYKSKPEDVKLIMIDPKVVELSVYNGIPHLFIPVVTDPKKAAGALNWGVAEMTDRYNKFAEYGVRDLKGYNHKIEALKDVDDENKPKKLPQIVIIVDELADLMMVAPGEVEDSICRLAQLARAAGIHLIIATQRPSVNVITGLIKANMPSRIAFSVSSGVDSRTIIDMNGAEKLLGKGDMLFYPQGYQKPARIQGAFVSDEEVSDVVDFLKNKNVDMDYNTEMEEQIARVQQAVTAVKGAEDVDALFADAGKFIIDKDKASIGMLQRVFKIGFNRAARIMDQLSDAGVVGPEEGTKPRKILMSSEQFDNYLEEN